jgi:methionyl aminopeptidase
MTIQPIKTLETTQGQIPLYGADAFAAMREAGILAAQTLNFIAPHVVAGVSTQHLNDLCHDFITSRGAICAPLNYKGFPRSICTSINHVVCHGIPSPTDILKDGDIINIDVTPIVNGWYGDSSRMYQVGKVSKAAERLCRITYECLMRAIDIVRPGVRLGDIGHIIQQHAEGAGYSVVRDFCGHGLGQVFHTAPSVVHYGKPNTGMVLEEGMLFTIEPMINMGKYETRVLADGWTAITRDRSLSAQYEHSLGVTADGCMVFTA